MGVGDKDECLGGGGSDGDNPMNHFPLTMSLDYCQEWEQNHSLFEKVQGRSKVKLFPIYLCT